MKTQTVNIDTKSQDHAQLLTNHEARIQSLETNEDRTMNRVADILEKQLPEIKQSITALSVKITTMSALNVAAIVMGVIINRLIK